MLVSLVLHLLSFSHATFLLCRAVELYKNLPLPLPEFDVSYVNLKIHHRSIVTIAVVKMRVLRFLQVFCFVANVGAKTSPRQFSYRGTVPDITSSGHGDTNKYIVEFSQASSS